MTSTPIFRCIDLYESREPVVDMRPVHLRSRRRKFWAVAIVLAALCGAALFLVVVP